VKSRRHFHGTDLRGVGRLAVDATIGVTDLVEALHHSISRGAPPIGSSAPGRTRGITGFVYRTIRQVTRLVGGGLDAALARLVPELSASRPTAEREAVLAALNGVLGDYLARTRNPLAIAMRLRRHGEPLVLERAALSASVPDAKRRLAILIHGLCLNDLQWRRKDHDHGTLLEGEAGFTTLYLHYNSGRHISENGRELAALLEALVNEWPVPVEGMVIVGHSMGGLVARSACHQAEAEGLRWPARLLAMAFLGTPHFGAPLERGGKRVDFLLDASPYSAPFARLGRVRSAGITDLHHGALLDEDWARRDRFEARRAPRKSVPLPRGVACFALAATLGKSAEGLGGRLVGDGLVPVASALGRHRAKARDLGIPESRCWLGAGLGHLDLLSSHEAGAQLQRWLSSAGAISRAVDASQHGAQPGVPL
jgi:pimeloyl-ACP methyl ester carboxylesterase